LNSGNKIILVDSFALLSYKKLIIITNLMKNLHYLFLLHIIFRD